MRPLGRHVFCLGPMKKSVRRRIFNTAYRCGHVVSTDLSQAGMPTHRLRVWMHLSYYCLMHSDAPVTPKKRGVSTLSGLLHLDCVKTAQSLLTKAL
jgi:hypothetical protein